MSNPGVIAALIAAAFADTFFPTGFIFYGGFVAAGATTALLAGYEPVEVGLASFAGCMLGEIANILTSKTAGANSRLLRRAKGEVEASTDRANRYQKKFGAKLSSRPMRLIGLVLLFVLRPTKDNPNDGFLAVFCKVLVRRFLVSARPLNAHFVYQSHGACVALKALALSAMLWVVFWLFIFNSLAKMILDIAPTWVPFR